MNKQHEWIFWQTIGQGEHPLRWVSHFQLYSDFMLSTGHPGPIHRKGWEDGATVDHLGLLGFGFKQRTRWWTKVWKQTLRHLDVSPAYAYGLPSSSMVLMHTGIAALPWPPDRIQKVDRWMLSVAGASFRRNSRLIDSLPLVSHSAEFTPIYLSTSGL